MINYFTAQRNREQYVEPMSVVRAFGDGN